MAYNVKNTPKIRSKNKFFAQKKIDGVRKFFFAKSCRGHCYDHFKPSVKSLGLMVRFLPKSALISRKTDFCPPARMPLRNQRFLRFISIIEIDIIRSSRVTLTIYF